MKQFLITTGLLAHCIVVLAQQPFQTIRGKVVDEASGAPIPFATVVLPGTDPLIGTTTTAEGDFTIDKVPVGRYDLRITYLGYEPALLKEIAVSSSKETFVNVSIRESITKLDDVVVKPKVNKEEPLNNMATVSARMLSVEEARRYAGGFDDPARLASAFAGVASNVANNGIVVRGNAPRALQWKMEGVEIPNPNHFADLSAFGGGGLTALSTQMLANSDFFTGAFPAEYSNALSGVFDIFMRNGTSQKPEHTFQLGAIGIDASSEGPFKKGGRSSYLFNYRYSTLALMKPLLPEEAQGTSYQDLSFKLYFPTNKSGVFSFWGLGLRDRSGQLAQTDSSQWLYAQNREEADAKQYMGATGLSHDYIFRNNAQLKTTLAATVSGLDWRVKRLNHQQALLPQSQNQTANWNFVLTSSLTKKFSPRHTNKTGIVLTGLRYDMLLKDAGTTEQAPLTVVDETGFSTLLTAYTSSAFRFSDRLTLNLGLNGQLFSLNNRYTLEPRAGIKWQMTQKQYLGLAYGLHSRLERLNYYFTRTPLTDTQLVNRNLDFTKAHHLVLSYGVNLSENVLLKIEPYYQYLYSVPVVRGTSFSFINLTNQWYLSEKLVNTGKGRNYGLDLTLERYLSRGYYFLLTTSLFNSEYSGDNGIWRNTMFNRRYLSNLLVGKEWQVGRSRQHVLGINTRLTVQGGEPYTPVNTAASLAKKEVVYTEGQLYSRQLPPALLAHFTASYKINRAKTAHELALKVLNATQYGDFYGFRYNYRQHTIDEHREAIMIPNVSYRIEF
ncbi:TonB-dependent receptor [Telluribacter sp.]|jgi:hypothetical protein|uniref:TonB-dependent receptor n=1 Tax=Telluribacter sp. TaxID=1978767 RepID=UPI002E144C94|nr:TonB-dependent receptor [Telluribacter sp.]